MECDMRLMITRSAQVYQAAHSTQGGGKLKQKTENVQVVRHKIKSLHISMHLKDKSDSSRKQRQSFVNVNILLIFRLASQQLSPLHTSATLKISAASYG